MKIRRALPLECGIWQVTKLLGEKLITEIFSPLGCSGLRKKRSKPSLNRPEDFWSAATEQKLATRRHSPYIHTITRHRSPPRLSRLQPN